MAALTSPHWEAVSPAIQELIHDLGKSPLRADFYLAGGTALALRIGHRRSFDLDIFSERDEVLAPTRRRILHALAELKPQTLEEADGNLVLEVAGQRMGFFSYGYRLIEPAEDVAGVAIASTVDLGLMKLDALIGRGSRKDFYDLFFIARQTPLSRLLELAKAKFPFARDFELMAVESLVQFENADRDLQPELLIDGSWEEVKSFFEDQAQTLGLTWFER